MKETSSLNPFVLCTARYIIPSYRLYQISVLTHREEEKMKRGNKEEEKDINQDVKERKTKEKKEKEM